MTRHSKKHQRSETSQDESLLIARGTQRPGQTKEQTKLVAQGIRKGIDLYKKQQSAKSRELDKKLKKVNQQLASARKPDTDIQERLVYRQHWLPWVLLVLSWLAMAVYWLAR